MRKTNKKGFSFFSQMASINYLVQLLHATEEEGRRLADMMDQMRQARVQKANSCVVLRAVIADLVFIIQIIIIIIIISSLIF
jgi:hypothetical protein